MKRAASLSVTSTPAMRCSCTAHVQLRKPITWAVTERPPQSFHLQIRCQSFWLTNWLIGDRALDSILVDLPLLCSADLHRRQPTTAITVGIDAF